MRYLIVICLLFIHSSCKKSQVPVTTTSSIPSPWTDSSARHPKSGIFKALIDKYTKKGLPGISLLIRDNNGTWMGASGKAGLENNINFTTGTISKVASITKLFMGVLTFKMMEDSVNSGLGYKDLQQPLKKWLPSRVISKLPYGDIITLGQCLKHETGIPDIIDQNPFYLAVLNEPNKKWEAEELLSYIYDKKPLFKPGDTAIYSNTNTILVSMVMEAVTGRKHSDLLKQYIFQPLGLYSTYYQPHDVLPNTVAQGYYDLYNNNTIVNVSNLVTGSGNGYGGIYSNLYDLYKFGDALFLKKNLLSVKSASLMMTFGKTDGDNEYGYGIQHSFLSRGVNAGYGHKGRDVGYTANLFYFPNKNVLQIFFINYGTDSKSNLRQVFYDFQEELMNITLQ